MTTQTTQSPEPGASADPVHACPFGKSSSSARGIAVGRAVMVDHRRS
ncbi:hypothetical protein AB0E67_27675 [Streptomyces sp. NPDC032161]